MQNVNWWLMALAFVLGLVLTLALMIRWVKREVPEYAEPGAGAAGASTLKGNAGDVAEKEPSGAGKGTGERADGGVGTAAAEEPYGPGSARVTAGAAAPSGYDIKGNEDSMLYHTADSPAYKQTIAEIWFRDVETAEKAGFNRWDSGKSQRDEQ